MEELSRYVIGIDLGTTNSSVAYVDAYTPSIQNFPIPQLTALGVVTSEKMLPSFYYFSRDSEFNLGDLDLPWKKKNSFVVGVFAKELGSLVPTQLVQSAKSWLCNPAANRKDKILPLEGIEGKKISPVDATAAYLSHIRDAWNARIAKNETAKEFEQQEIVLTVPASFDEVARRLTVEAARQAGYKNLTLLEEPQAAFYTWIQKNEAKWQHNMQAGQSVFVCDVGGGTTDFSWIDVVQGSEGLAFQRMAVGDHLLLGGDNMDAALAHYVEKRLQKELEPSQWSVLLHQARCAKETLLDAFEESTFPIHLHGTGSRVVGGGIDLTISRKEVIDVLESGFFQSIAFEEAIKLKKGSGLRQMGLPYEADPSIIKHIAAFLKSNGEKCPDYILFNGGSLKPKLFQESIVSAMKKWFSKTPQILESQDLDLAVSRGAAYYGMTRRGVGVRIGGGVPRAYYIGLEVKGKSQALTLIPRGAEEGTRRTSQHLFHLTANIPVRFQIYTSHTRLGDHFGGLVEIEEENMFPLSPLQTVLHFGKRSVHEQKQVPVSITANLTEIGLLELSLHSNVSEHQWNLEFQLRIEGSKSQRSDETFDVTYLSKAKDVIGTVFGEKPLELMKALEDALDLPRLEWSPSVLRGLWEGLYSQNIRKGVSPVHESRWWNTAGFLLRPGFGYPLDDHRLKELWRAHLQVSQFFKNPDCYVQRLICYRRVSGGLNKGQQQQIASQIIPEILDKKTNRIVFDKRSDKYHYGEKIRTLASFEFIDEKTKHLLGEALLERILNNEAFPCDYWAFGRIGARHLVYGSIVDVVSKDVCEQWVQRLFNLDLSKNELALYALALLTRKTQHREVDVSDAILKKSKEYINQSTKVRQFQKALEKEGTLTREEQEHLLGDQLPVGLTLEL